MFFKNNFKVLIFVSIFLLIGGNVFASFSDGFDTYTDGSLDGQGGWTGSGVYEVQATTTQAGSKAIFGTQGAYSEIKKAINSLNGRVVGWIRTTLPTTSASIVLGVVDTTFQGAEIIFLDTGNLVLWGDTMETIFADYSPDTWYKVEMEWRNSDSKVRARANDGAWTNWLDPRYPWTEMTHVYLHTGAGEGYWDSLTYNESYITISSDFATSILAYAGQFFTDLSSVIIFAVGLPLGFWVIKKIISLVRAR